MALLQEIQVPLLAVNDTTLTVVEINFSTGSEVKKGDLIMVFETSKTTYDVEAEADGYIQYLCEADQDYEVNEVVAKIYSEAVEVEVIPIGKPLPPGRQSLLPAGQPSSTGMAICQPLSFQTSALSQPYPNLQLAGPSAPAGSLPFWEGETLFSLEAMNLITSSGIDRSAFAGKDFVNKWDVLTILQSVTGTSSMTAASSIKEVSSTATASKQSKTAPAKAILPADPTKVILEKLSSGKKREIEYLGEVQSTGLTSTINVFVETENIFTFISRSLKYLKDSLLPVIVYEVSRLLANYPLLNAYFTGEAIARYKEVNTGFAIDIDKGLKVLKIPGAGQKSISEIEEAIMQLSGRYLDETLQIEDLTDITFTITDLSSEGVAFFRPLINKMNSAILGISAIDQKLQRCTLSLTFDHRVTEGKLVALFLHKLKERLESYQPVRGLQTARNIACFKCLKTLKDDLSDTGFVKCVTPEGKEGYICQACLKGY